MHGHLILKPLLVPLSPDLLEGEPEPVHFPLRTAHHELPCGNPDHLHPNRIGEFGAPRWFLEHTAKCLKRFQPLRAIFGVTLSGIAVSYGLAEEIPGPSTLSLSNQLSCPTHFLGRTLG